jgi:hypothetical protein
MFRRAITTQVPRPEEENPYLLSFSDIMAGLLGLFILALIAVMILLDQQKHQLKDATDKAQVNAAQLRDAFDRIGKTIQSIQIRSGESPYRKSCSKRAILSNMGKRQKSPRDIHAKSFSKNAN